MSRSQLPSGTVTFLFTDIEGSTRLLHELGADDYKRALAEHRRILRQAFTAHGGAEVDTQGDAFFVAFPTAPGALGAAARGTEGLASGPIRVRMGIHTGTPLLGAEGYVGVDVHRAARIAACGHGGQVLVSSSTAALTGTDDLRDLGEHRLKDLSAPERLYQLGEEDFPPLKSLYRTNLPIPATAFLGRDAELAEVVSLLASEEVRLLTLTGPGGTGKTRLALQAAARSADAYPHGVYWVPLAPLRDPALVVEEAARALGAKDGPVEHIADKGLLVLVDNFEHVIEAAPALADLLAACPNLKLLVTSREPLRLSGEREYTVPTLEGREAVALFLARAPAAEPDGAVHAICMRLDCLPLAVELAAARAKALSATQILERLEQRLPLLTGGPRDAPERQQTLRAAIEWSYELLDEEEQLLFARLAVFAGGCTLSGAEAVCDAHLDVLQSLAEKSLVRHSGERFWMLETIREYAAEQLEDSGQGEELRHRYAAHFAALAEEADPHLRGGSAQKLWFDRLESEFDNIRAAMAWASSASPELALRLGGNLAFFFWGRGRWDEIRAWLDSALANGEDQPPSVRAKALEGAAVVAGAQFDPVAEARYADESLALYSDLGNEFGVASALREQAKAAAAEGDYERARSLYIACVDLARRIGDVWNDAVALNNLGDLELKKGDFERARELCLQSHRVRLDYGDRWGSALALFNAGLAELLMDRLSDAEPHLREALSASHEVGSVVVVDLCLEGLAVSAMAGGHVQKAVRLQGAAAALRDNTGIALDGVESDLHERTAASLSSALGADSFSHEFELGRKLQLDEAVQIALRDDP